MNKTIPQDSLQTLECLRIAVEKTLERKRRLNQYAVIWEDGKPVFIGAHNDQATLQQEKPL